MKTLSSNPSYKLMISFKEKMDNLERGLKIYMITPCIMCNKQHKEELKETEKMRCNNRLTHCLERLRSRFYTEY